MALLFESRRVASDALGDAYSGALLYVYVSGGLVLADIFSDPGLDPGSPLANPLSADADGRFAQVFLATGLYDVVVKTSAGVTLYTEDAVSGLGESDGTFTRDFTNSRLSISGTGGVVSIEFRPATGDDVGGAGRLGGSDGTQADTIEIDAADTTITGDVDVTGSLTVGDAKGITEATKRLTEVLQTEPVTFAAEQYVDIPLPDSPTGTRGWRIRLYDLIMSTNGNVCARLSYDATPTYKSGASDYGYTYYVAASGSVGIGADDVDDEILLSPTLLWSTTTPGIIDIEVMTPNAGVGSTSVWGRILGRRDVGAGVIVPGNGVFHGYGYGDYGRATYLRIFSNSGAYTFTGKYSVVAVRGLGE